MRVWRPTVLERGCWRYVLAPMYGMSSTRRLTRTSLRQDTRKDAEADRSETKACDQTDKSRENWDESALVSNTSPESSGLHNKSEQETSAFFFVHVCLRLCKAERDTTEGRALTLTSSHALTPLQALPPVHPRAS